MSSPWPRTVLRIVGRPELESTDRIYVSVVKPNDSAEMSAVTERQTSLASAA